MRFILALLALVLPPLVLAGTPSRAARWTVLLLWAAALGVFFGVAWGAGLVMSAVAGLIAAVSLLRSRRPAVRRA